MPNFYVGRLPNSSDVMMTLMFAANRTTTLSTDITSTSTSLQITTMEFYKLSCVFVSHKKNGKNIFEGIIIL